METELVRIPEGWFWMGSDSGQDNERPVHRVWVDAFLLASRQVTNSDYSQFLLAEEATHPPFPFSGGLMEILRPIIQPALLLVLH